MPIFEFDCHACREPFDELVRNNEAIKDVVCPKCGSKKVKKSLDLRVEHQRRRRSQRQQRRVCAERRVRHSALIGRAPIVRQPQGRGQRFYVTILERRQALRYLVKFK